MDLAPQGVGRLSSVAVWRSGELHQYCTVSTPGQLEAGIGDGKGLLTIFANVRPRPRPLPGQTTKSGRATLGSWRRAPKESDKTLDSRQIYPSSGNASVVAPICVAAVGATRVGVARNEGILQGRHGVLATPPLPHALSYM